MEITSQENVGVPLRVQLNLFLVAAVVLTIDQLSKWAVRSRMEIGEVVEIHPLLQDVFDLAHVTNSGSAFGMFKSGGAMLTVLAILVSGAIVYYNRTLAAEQVWLRTALGLQVGGAIGNMIDRLHQGYVTDFFHLHYWPVFNVADAAISIGVVILVVLLRSESKPAPRRPAVAVTEPGSTPE
jgi:signal peptidase II